jgi:hypothetical protein
MSTFISACAHITSDSRLFSHAKITCLGDKPTGAQKRDKVPVTEPLCELEPPVRVAVHVGRLHVRRAQLV